MAGGIFTRSAAGSRSRAGGPGTVARAAARLLSPGENGDGHSAEA